MKYAFLLVAVFCFVQASPQKEGKRLIAFSEENRFWLSEKQAAIVEVESDNFMDITDFPDPSPKNFPVFSIPTKCIHQTTVNQLIGELEENNIQSTIESLSNFYTRYYNSETGKQAAEFLYSQYNSFSAGRSDITVEYFHHSWKMPSIIARIEGNDPNKAGTRIIVGAHEDSIGKSSTAKSPGADDDASGTSTILEVFRVLAQTGFKPNRTVEFHAYSAEEGGLRGSQAIASEYYSLDILVETMIQIDMDMYGGAGSPIGIVTDYTDPELTTFLTLLVDTYSQLTWENTKCGYACSDHASWTKYGYRSAFPIEALMSEIDPYIHSQEDTLSRIDVSRGFEFAKFLLGYVVELSS